jgi:hypothetical protein
MGIQSAAARALRVPGVTTTYITGTWTSLISGLIGRLPWLRNLHEAQNIAMPGRGTSMQGGVVGVYTPPLSPGPPPRYAGTSPRWQCLVPLSHWSSSLADCTSAAGDEHDNTTWSAFRHMTRHTPRHCRGHQR